MADHHDLPLGPQDLGDKLEDFLDRLAAAGLATSPRDRINATRLAAALIARGKVHELRDLKPHLAVLLARSPAERDRFMILFDGVEPPKKENAGKGENTVEVKEIWNPLAALIDRCERLKPVLPRAALVLALVAASPFAWKYWNRGPEINPGETVEQTGRGEPRLPPQTEAAPDIKLPDDAALKRIAQAAERFEGAPTIDELAEEIAKNSPIVWPAASYAIRLNELSGLPRSVPLALYGSDGRDGRTWARLALALERIERPGRESAFTALRDAANTALMSAPQPLPVYALAAKMKDWYRNGADLPKDGGSAVLTAAIQERYYKEETKSESKPTPGEALDPDTIARALAIAGPAYLRRTGADAPWLPRHTAVAASLAPWWAAWMAMTLPIAFGVLWAMRTLALRRAYLRRRPPDLPPLHTKLVANAPSLARYDAAKFQAVARRLRTRTAKSTSRLDVDASIAATLKAGGEIPAPVYAVERHNPEYLVLIERRSGRDQDAERLRTIVRRMEGMVSVTVFYYQNEPSRLEPEGGGRSLGIEQLESLYPEHRLVILGSGAGFLDPATLKPLPSVERLSAWSRRVLLTPLAVAEWGGEELELSRELKMPVGRATLEGMDGLPGMLGLEGAELQSMTDDRGDNLARPLPLDMRYRPERYLYNRPPPGEPAREIVRQLRNYLDGRAFEWLAALAVYPAVQWDLTLYLGVTLPETPGGNKNPDGSLKTSFDVLYSDDRLAALTQLPWLREGIMPNWLRSALIAGLSEERREEVRTALTSMIGHARIGEDGDGTIRTAIARERQRIAKEQPKDRLPPERLFEDQVLLDFLAEGRQEDFEVTGANWLENETIKSWVKRLGILETAAIAVAIAYGAAALFVSPKASDGALVSGAWLPLILLGAGALLALAVADREPAYAILRRCIFGLAAPALTFAALMLMQTSVVQPAIGKIAIGVTNPFATVLAAALAFLLVFRRVTTWMGIPRQSAGPLGRLGRAAALVSWTAAVLVLLALAISLVDSASSTTGASRDTRLITAALFGLSIFLLAWLASRHLPEKLPKPMPSVRGAKLSAAVVGRRMALAMAPIVPAVLLAFYVASSSTMLEDPIPGGVTAMAELPEAHLVALGGADASIRIVDMSSGSAKVTGTLGGSEQAVASLAFGPDTRSAPLDLWASYADGSMIHFESRDGGKFEANGIASEFAGSPSRVLTSIDKRGTFVTASESEGGVIKLAASGGGDLEFPDSGPVTALTAAGDGRFAAATLDGSVFLVFASERQPPKILAETRGKTNLPGRARRLEYDSKSNVVTAYGDDGTVMTLPATAEGFANANAPRTRVSELSLGAAVSAVPYARPVGPPKEPKLVALVVGNGAYQKGPMLANAPNDGRAAAKALYGLGFAVVEVIDADQKQFRDALDKFRERARDADVALFYYAGHAYATGGQNRLVPIDVGGKRSEAPNAIAESDILAAIAPARALRLAIIDSHDNKQLPKEKSVEEGATRGLGSDDTSEPDLPATRTLTPGTAMIYAGGEGTEALDRIPGGSANSPFTTALVERLKEPVGPILDLFEAIQHDVQKSTNAKQKPVIFSSLSDPITITGRVSAKDDAPPAATDTNRMFVLSIGVGDYQLSARKLKFAADDATSVAKGFAEIGRGFFTDVNTTVMLDADVTRETVEKRVRDIAEQMDARDTFVMFMVGQGHGSRDGFYFLTSQADPSSKLSLTSAISSEDLAQWLGAMRGKGLLIVDAVEFGTAPALTNRDLAFSVISASGPEGTAYEGNNGHSILTSALLDALSQPSPKETKGIVTLTSLWHYLEPRVMEISSELAVKQTPTLFRPPSLPDFPLGVIPSKDQTADANAQDPRSLSPEQNGIAPQDDLAFAYYPPGDLTRGEKGVTDRKVYLPDIIFPLKVEKGQHAYLNSQIYGYGGGGWDGKGALGGAESDPRNYDAMRMRDNFCEVRTTENAFCPSGKGKIGQNIRPPSAKTNVWEALAVADGVITAVTSFPLVTLTGTDGTEYKYYHMHPQSITVKAGQNVKQGDVLGRIANFMNGQAGQTTIHLNLEARQSIAVGKERKTIAVPPYTSLIAAYRRLKGLDPGIDASGNLIVDPEHEIGAGKIPRPREEEDSDGAKAADDTAVQAVDAAAASTAPPQDITLPGSDSFAAKEKAIDDRIARYKSRANEGAAITEKWATLSEKYKKYVDEAATVTLQCEELKQKLQNARARELSDFMISEISADVRKCEEEVGRVADLRYAYERQMTAISDAVNRAEEETTIASELTDAALKAKARLAAEKSLTRTLNEALGSFEQRNPNLNTTPKEEQPSDQSAPSLDIRATLRAALLAPDQTKVKAILDGGWDANTPLDGDGNAALHILMEVCEKTPDHDRDVLVALARLLINDRATPDLKNKFGDTALAIARSPRYCGAEHPVVALLSGLNDQAADPASTEPEPTQPYPAIPPLSEIADDYQKLFDTAEIALDKLPTVKSYVERIFQGRARYEAVEAATGVPWYFVGLIHGMEAAFSFNAHIHNGDSLKQRTFHSPANRPTVWNPPNDWETSAIDAMQFWKLDQEKSWTVPEILYRLEKHNGWRSRLQYNINTPYLWSYTQHYTKGKFVADGVWDPNAVSKQPGTAAQLKLILADPRFNAPSDGSRGVIERPATNPLSPLGTALPEPNGTDTSRSLAPPDASLATPPPP